MDIGKTILDFVSQKELGWYGYAKRMTDERISKKVLAWISPARRKRGRPTVTWMQNITKTMIDAMEENLRADRNGRRKKKKIKCVVILCSGKMYIHYKSVNNKKIIVN